MPIENNMVIDSLWEPPQERRCRMCKQITCYCEDEIGHAAKYNQGAIDEDA